MMMQNAWVKFGKWISDLPLSGPPPTVTGRPSSGGLSRESGIPAGREFWSEMHSDDQWLNGADGTRTDTAEILRCLFPR